ncbi:MAG: ribonuclease III [Clostridia bacterium]|nr:ribonuclease III [Clostridia bacterium]
MVIKMKTGEMNGASLAYLGDAVIELKVREMLLSRDVGEVGKMNRIADTLVRATYQSQAMDRLLPLLTEEENAVYKRGRNTHSHTVPKRAKVSDYRKATGMEALFGFLHLEGRTERLNRLFDVAFPEEENV